MKVLGREVHFLFKSQPHLKGVFCRGLIVPNCLLILSVSFDS